MHMLTRVTLIIAALLTLTAPALAQDETPAERHCISGTGDSLTTNECIRAKDLLGMLDLANPENALFTLMGSAPDTVIRPKVGDQFMVSILPQLSDALGSEQYSIGLEANPGLWMMPSSFTLAEYQGQTSAWTGGDARRRQLRSAQFWSRFTISAAATRTTDDGEMTRYGVGFNYNYDSGAPMEVMRTGAYGNCIARTFPLNPADERLRAEGLAAPEVEREHPGLRTSNRTEFIRLVEAKATELLENDDRFAALRAQEVNVGEKVQACAAEVAPWNRETYGVGVAFYTAEASAPVTPGGPDVSEEEGGVGAWISYTRPVGDHGQVAFSGRYTDNLLRTREINDESIQEALDGWRLGARYTHSFSETADRRAIRGFVEVAYAEEEFGAVDDEFTQAGVGLEVQLQKNVFFQVVVGDTFGSDIDRSEYLSGQIRWSFSPAPAS